MSMAYPSLPSFLQPQYTHAHAHASNGPQQQQQQPHPQQHSSHSHTAHLGSSPSMGAGAMQYGGNALSSNGFHSLAGGVMSNGHSNGNVNGNGHSHTSLNGHGNLNGQMNGHSHPALSHSQAQSQSHTRVQAASASPSNSSVDPVTPELTPNQPSVSASLDDRRVSSVSVAGSGEDQIECKWADCTHFSPSPDELYDHLCNVHVGRKSTGNLNLTCGWEGCGVKCVKRDHITSHLRVHTPLKPHPCTVCGKSFKRPQDLKKHERIHTQEHHQIHKLSKAATSHDPAFNSRVNPTYPASHLGDTRRSSGVIDGDDKSGSPTPSALAMLHRKQHEELAAYQHREMMVLQQLAFQQQQTQAYAAQFAQESVPRGQKRGQEELGDFWSEMKKKKVEPVYNPDMISRLNSMVPPSLPALPSLNNGPSPSFMNSHNTTGSYPSFPAFGPNGSYAQNHASGGMEVPFGMPEIRTEDDLDMFNRFMISLGRDAAGLTMPQLNTVPMTHTASFGSGVSSSSVSSGSPLSDQSPIEDLFNPEELASLGLGGMPGIPSLSTSLPHPQTVNFGGMYPQLDNPRSRATSAPDVADFTKRAIAGLPRNQSMSGPSHGPSHGLGMGMGLGMPMPKFEQGMSMPYPDLPVNSNTFDFDFLAQSKQNVGASMQPRDFSKKTYRHVAPLGAAVSSRPAGAARSRLYQSSLRSTEVDDDELEGEDEDAEGSPRGAASRDGSITPMGSPKISVRSLLTSDDLPNGEELRLPALHIGDVEAHGDLPSLRELAALAPRPPSKRHVEDDIVRGVKRLELADGEPAPAPLPQGPAEMAGAGTGTHARVAQLAAAREGREGREGAPRRPVDPARMKHAALIKAWLVAVNLDFRRRRMEEREREYEMGLERDREYEEEAEWERRRAERTPDI